MLLQSGSARSWPPPLKVLVGCTTTRLLEGGIAEAGGVTMLTGDNSTWTVDGCGSWAMTVDAGVVGHSVRIQFRSKASQSLGKPAAFQQLDVAMAAETQSR